MNTKEVWRDAKGFEKSYQVSNLGRIKSKTRFVSHKRYNKQLVNGRIIKVTISKTGYLEVNLSIGNSKSKYMSVHRLVAMTFLENPFNKKTVNHKNGIKSDNRVCNLEWATQSENMKHAFKTGLAEPIKGENRYNSKVKEETVKEIFVKNNVLKISTRKLAKEYNVSRGCIMGITKGRTWKYLELNSNLIATS